MNHREAAKLTVRKTLQRGNLGISRDPQATRLVRTLNALGVTHVLDVGANIGQFATLLRSAGFRGRIDSFEPLPTAFSTLAARAGRDSRWYVHQFALGAEARTATMNISQNSYSSSLLEMTDEHLEAAPDSRFVDTVEVRLERIDDVVADLRVPASRTMLKVDTQGYEGRVLAGGTQLVGEVAAVQLELSMVELYAEQELFDDLRLAMSRAGLRLWSIEPGIADAFGRMLQCDGLFIRKDLL